MGNRRKILLKYSLVGALVGYLVFHPLVMLLSYTMTFKDSMVNINNTVGIMAVLLRSFSLDMLPWSISFALFNTIIGMYYGTHKNEKLEREKLIVSLQKALDDVKILSGMLPIYSWCKKTRNDKGYWQKIEAYLKTYSGLDFTHVICNDCARKEYPEYCQGAKKNT